ncbi:hypothetical protein HanIR_Chr11g0512171 [Helianthus annuus]|nr:hypothetical protein HanIR_Chr11g0512171 [Helianthus annuus]
MSSTIIPSLGMDFSGNTHHSPPHPTISFKTNNFPHNPISHHASKIPRLLKLTRCTFEWRWCLGTHHSLYNSITGDLLSTLGPLSLMTSGFFYLC